MLLALNLGNTRIAAATFETGDFTTPVSVKRFPNTLSREVFVTELLPFLEDVNVIAVGSVVPSLSSAVTSELNRLSPRVEVRAIDATTPVWSFQNLTREPGRVGVDRLANAEAALHLYGGGPINAPMIVVDAGTATTFSVISEKGEFLGGAIATGLEISRDALSARTAKLFSVDIDAPPANVVGTDTATAIRSGLIHGQASMIDEMIRRMSTELNFERLVTVGTGGAMNVLKPLLCQINHFDSELTLKGLAYAASSLRR